MAHWLGPLLLALVFCFQMAWTWQKWPHVLVDFGRELYVPWQLSEGAVLYRDIAYLNGPLSPYFNSVLFDLFGVSLMTLAVVNAVLLAILVGLVYRWLASMTDRTAATVACLVLLSVFAFSQRDLAGNYNFICPYSHEMTHGLFLSILMLVLLGRATRSFNRVPSGPRGAAGWAARGPLGTRLNEQPKLLRLTAAAGLCFGMVFLTKPELFVACAGAAGVFSVGNIAASRASKRQVAMATATFLTAAIIPPLAFTLALAQHLPFRDAVVAVTGGWRWIFSSDVSNLEFYQVVMGVHRPWLSLVRMLQVVARDSLLIVAVVFFDRWRCARHQTQWLGLALSCVAVSLLLRSQLFPYLIEGRALLFAAVATTVLCAAWTWRRHADGQTLGRALPLLAWSVLAMLLLLKMILAPRVHHYGFALAMPAGVLLAACLIHFLPQLCHKLWQGGTVLRRVVVCMVVFDAAAYFLWSSDHFAQKTFPVAAAGDRMMSEDPRLTKLGPGIQAALEEAHQVMPRDATFVALPEGIMLNYLTRHRNPTRFINFMPPELTIYGEDEVIREFTHKPPDFFWIVHKETPEYGVRFFGTEQYGEEIMEWVKANYHPVKTILYEPLCSSEFGIQILQRNGKRCCDAAKLMNRNQHEIRAMPTDGQCFCRTQKHHLPDL